MSLQSARELLSTHGWLSLTPMSFQNAVFARCILVTFKRGAYVYRLSDPAGGIYGLSVGQIAVEALPPESGPLVGDLLPPGAWCGEAAFVTQQVRRVGIRAASDCEALLLPAADLRNIMKTEDEAWRFLGLLAVLNTDRAMLVALNLMERDPQQRIIAVLLRLSGHLPRREPQTEVVDLYLSQDELATMANVSRTVVGECLRRLEANGLASQSYRKITVVNPAQLAVRGFQ
jgi:CRP/FNR family transcriptional regulator, cyclic AMP receptor protein